MQINIESQFVCDILEKIKCGTLHRNIYLINLPVVFSFLGSSVDFSLFSTVIYKIFRQHILHTCENIFLIFYKL